jgi:hypothetical protein
VKLGGLAQDARGSLNGLVFARCDAGAVVRTKTSGVQPVSRGTSTVRRVVGGLASRWADVLTDEDRAGWRVFADVHPQVNVFGDGCRGNACASFISVNARLVLCGGVVRDLAPGTWGCPCPLIGAVSVGLSGGVFSIFVVTLKEPLGAGYLAALELARPLSARPVPREGDWRSVNVAAGGRLRFGDDWSASVNRVYPGQAWVPGGVVWFRLGAVAEATGSYSVPFVVECQLGARTWWGVSRWGDGYWGS